MITKFTPCLIPPISVTYPFILPRIYRNLFAPSSNLGISYTNISLSSTHLRTMITLCCLGHSSTRRWPKQESGGGSEPIVEFMKPRGLMRKKKRQHSMNKEEVKQDLVLKNKSNLLTLEEWILASPNRNGCKSRVYPTFEKKDEGLYKKTGDSFSMLIMEVDEGDREMEDSSSRLSLNGKTKKRVSFKLPEVADIFILDSPGGYYSM